MKGFLLERSRGMPTSIGLYPLLVRIRISPLMCQIHPPPQSIDVTLPSEGPDRHRQGTLRDFFQEASKEKTGRILNVLDLKLGMEYRQCLPYQ